MRTVRQIESKLALVNAQELDELAQKLATDERQGVKAALKRARARIEREEAKREHLLQLYVREREIASSHGGGVVVGIDEVGRGPLAGPLAAGAVVLDGGAPMIEGLDDSKKLSAQQRTEAAERIWRSARACAVSFVSPQKIDEVGITAALRLAFGDALSQIESQGVSVDVVLLDGNPLGFDAREVNVVKGDATCASIAAASIIAKVKRDELMVRLEDDYPGYGFASNKGYGSEAHLRALRERGLSTMHRQSFCTKIISEAPSLQ